MLKALRCYLALPQAAALSNSLYVVTLWQPFGAVFLCPERVILLSICAETAKLYR
jgi:hypothetical protein